VFVSDISNSTALLQRLGDERAHTLVQDHNRLVRALLHRHEGVELQQTGDGFIAVFDDAANALHCAVRLQREIEERGLGGSSGLSIRVALHAGEVLVEEGRVFGVVMHTAAHICTSGRPGEILVSQPAWDALADPSEWVAEDLGAISLKGLFDPITLRHVDWRVK
jgi:class 3 adenylate cyclase